MNEEARVVNALRSGVLLGGAAAAIDVMWRAAAHSRAVALMADFRDHWRVMRPVERRRRLAVTLLTAVAAHLGLVATRDLPPGWLWTTIPALAVAVAIVLLLPVSQRSSVSEID
jgi:hypothetical protein